MRRPPRSTRTTHSFPTRRSSDLLLADGAAVHGDEAGAEAVHAGEVLVAGRLVDGALAAELGFHRHHGDAVGLHRAVAAALADQLVDEDAFGRIGIASALAAAAFFGGAGLVEEQHEVGRASWREREWRYV